MHFPAETIQFSCYRERGNIRIARGAVRLCDAAMDGLALRSGMSASWLLILMLLIYQCRYATSAQVLTPLYRPSCTLQQIDRKLKSCNFRFRLAAGGLAVLLRPIIDQLFNYVSDDECCVACKWAAVIQRCQAPAGHTSEYTHNTQDEQMNIYQDVFKSCRLFR